MACCCLTKDTGAGGGGVLATTERSRNLAEGLAAPEAPAPSTLLCCGATVGVVALTCADSTSRRSTLIMFRPTGWADAKFCCDVAVTPLLAVWVPHLVFWTVFLALTFLWLLFPTDLFILVFQTITRFTQ